MARLELIGGFQAANVLVAAGLCIGAGRGPEAVFRALPSS
jgi:UDP-N-acetylmuramoyl-L-alanyl-D-glutamate--2,6-diaminopimelate ligase